MPSGLSIIIIWIVNIGCSFLVYTAATQKQYKRKVLIALSALLFLPLGLFILSSPIRIKRPTALVTTRRFFVRLVPAFIAGLIVSYYAGMSPIGLRTWLGTQYATLLKLYYEGRISIFVEGNLVDFGTYQMQIFVSLLSLTVLSSTGLVFAAAYWRFRWITAIAFVCLGLFLGLLHEFRRTVSVTDFIIDGDFDAAQRLIRINELPIMELIVLSVVAILLAFRMHSAEVRQS